MVLAKEVTDPALTVLGAVDVARQGGREVRDAVDERVPEQDRESQENQQRDERHDRHRATATLHAPVLQRHHDRVEDQGDEAADQSQQ